MPERHPAPGASSGLAWGIVLRLPEGLDAPDLHAWWSDGAGTSGDGACRAPGQVELPGPGHWGVVVSGVGIAPHLFLVEVAPEAPWPEVELVPTGSLRLEVSGDDPLRLTEAEVLLEIAPEAWPGGEQLLLDRRFLPPSLASDLARAVEAWGLARREQEGADAAFRRTVLERLSGFMAHGARSMRRGGGRPEPFHHDLSEDGILVLNDLPAPGPYRWRLSNGGPYEVEPKPARLFDTTDRGGVVVDLARSAVSRILWSEDFEIEIHGETTVQGRLVRPATVRGRLDLAAAGAPVKRAWVGVDRIHDGRAEGQPRARFREVFVEVPPDDGRFRLEGMAPGVKTLDAAWESESGDWFLVHVADFELLEGEDRDLGILSPRGAVLDVVARLVGTEDASASLQSELGALESAAAPIGLFLLDGEGASVAFEGPLQIGFRRPVSIHGLASSRVYLRADLHLPDFARSLHEHLYATRLEETIEIGVAGTASLALDFELRRSGRGRLRLVAGEDVELPDELALDVSFFGASRGRLTLPNSILFSRDRHDGWVGEVPLEAYPSFLVLRSPVLLRDPSLPGPEPRGMWVGTADLPEPAVGVAPEVVVPLLEGVMVDVVLSDPERIESEGPVLAVDVVGWPKSQDPHYLAGRIREGRYRLGPIPPGVTICDRGSGHTWQVPPQGGAWRLDG